MNWKVIAAGLLAMFIVVAALVIPVTEDSEGATTYTDTATGLKYTLYEDTATVGANTKATGDVVIPSQLTVGDKTYTVNALANNAFKGASLKSVVLPDTVETIGTYAFQNNKSLETITLPAGIKALPNYMMQNAVKVEVINIPASVESVGNYAFDGMTALKEVRFAEGSSIKTLGNNVFSKCTSMESMDLSSLKSLESVGNNTFNNSSKLSKVVFGESVITIGNNTFDGTALNEPVYANTIDGRTLLNSGSTPGVDTFDIAAGTKVVAAKAFAKCTAGTINIPASVTALGDSAFANNTKVKTVVLGDGSALKTIFASAFYKCTSLSSINLEKAAFLESVNDKAFLDCSSLKSITFGSAPVVTDGAFRGSGIEHPVYVGTTLYHAGTSADFEIKDGTTTIAGYAFYQCRQSTVEIPASVVKLNAYAFALSKIETIVIPATVTDMSGGYTFQDTSSLKSLVVEEGIAYLPGNFIDGCKAITSFKIPASVASLGNYAFSGTGFTEFTLPGTVETIGEGLFEGCESLKSFTFPDGIVDIPLNMFNKCTVLDTVNIPASVTGIGDSAFSGTGFTEFTLPGTVETLGTKLFEKSLKLESFTISNGPSTISDSMFNGCTALKTVVIPESITVIGSNSFAGTTALESVTIPESVTAINASAFNKSGLKEVVIPSNVTSMPGANTFAYCPNLTKVVIESPYVSMGTYTFRDSKALETIDIHGMLKGVANTFTYCVAENIIVHYPMPFLTTNMCNNLEQTKDDCGCTYLAVNDADGPARMLLKLGSKCTTVDPEYRYVTSDVLKKAPAFDESTGLRMVDGYVLKDDVLVYATEKKPTKDIPEGVTKLGPQSFSQSTNSAPYTIIRLPSTIATVEFSAVSTAADIVLAPRAFDAKDKCFPEGTPLYIQPGYVDQMKTPVTGIYVETPDAVLTIDVPEGCTVDAVTGSGHAAFSVILEDEYRMSEYKVLADGKELVSGEESIVIGGKTYDDFVVCLEEGIVNVTITGVELNRYSVDIETIDGTKVYGATVNIPSGSDASYGIIAPTGYVIGESFGIKIGDHPLEFKVIDETSVTFALTVTGDTVVTVDGFVKASDVKVSFNVNGGSAVDTQNVVPGKAPVFEIPVKEGGSFLGWYTDSALTSLYVKGTPVYKDTMLHAKWSDDTESVKVNFGMTSGKGVVTAIANGYLQLVDGGLVPKGSDVEFAFSCDNPYSVIDWTVDGIPECRYKDSMTLCIDSDTRIGATSEYSYVGTFVNKVYMDTPVIGDYVPKWTAKGSGETGSFKGMYYTPVILGDYIYSKCDNILVKIDPVSGEIVDSVATATSFSGYYQYLTVGNGYVFDPISGKVYNQGLEQVFSLSMKSSKAYYHDGLVFINDSDGNTHAFSAVDGDETVADEVHGPVWSKYVGSRTTSFEGGSTILFGDGYAVTMDFVDTLPVLSTFDYLTGEVIDTFVLEGMLEASGEKGYLDLSEGYVTATFYRTGQFSSVNGTELPTVGAMRINDDGTFVDASYRYFFTEIGQSYHTSFIVESGYGFIGSDKVFQVYDMETLDVVATVDLPINIGHGSMAMAVHDGKVRAYYVPYESATDLPGVEFDLATKEIESFLMKDVATAQWGSQQPRFLENGDIVYVNDAGNIYCVGSSSYTVTWIVDGEETSATYAAGETPKFDGTPVKKSTETTVYTFSGWDRTIAPVTGDVTYTAVFTESARNYTVSFYEEDGKTLVETVTVPYGGTPEAPEAPVKAAGKYPYEFVQWSDADGIAANLDAPVTSDASYVATYRLVVPAGELYGIDADVKVTSAKTVMDLTVTPVEGAETLKSAYLVVIAAYDDGRFVNSYPALDLSSGKATLAVSTNGLTSVVIEVVESIPDGQYVSYGGYVYTPGTE